MMLVLLLLNVAPLSGNAQRRTVRKRTPQKQEETVFFVVSGEESEPGQPPKYSMDALAVLRGGKYVSPMDEYDDKSERRFADKFYKAGKKYRLLFGGGHAGTATVESWQEGCNAIHSSIKVESSANIHGRIYGLATNSDSLGKKETSRRALTATEREALMSLVKSIYRRNKTSNALLRSLKVNNLTATDLNGDGRFEVIGDFEISLNANSTEGARRDLFLIATPSGAGYRAELAYFQSYKMDSGFGRGSGFLDQLDMDGDGIAEVVTIDQGFDAYGYSIYKKQRGTWRRIYSGTGDAC
jgi:hypothetical protein